MARTHTEVYRRYEGVLRGHALRSWPLVAAGLRTALKAKLPLLLLYLPVGITAIVYSFIVYGKYAGESMAETIGVMEGLVRAFAQRAVLHIEVAQKVAEANHVLRLFALLAVAWYGAGVIAEDRRLGAHLLYFARPITRLDYFLGRFLTVAFFGALASLVPSLVICLVAAWSSPEWSFLTQEWPVLLQTVAYSAIWITVTTSIVLCASALVRRKTLALAGVFGFFVVDHGLGSVLGVVDPRYQAVSVLYDVRRVRNWLFGVDDWRHLGFGLDTAFLVLGGTVAVALAIVARRIARLEVVG